MNRASQFSITSAVASVLCLLLPLAAGCGKKTSVDVYPTTGVVTVDGKPVADAEITLYAVDESLRGVGKPLPTGKTDAEGKFSLTSFVPNDGAPAGEFKVAILWMETKPSGSAEPATQIDRLKGRYEDPQASGLTATVKAEDTELPTFELTSK
jgi:hypothetical protein